MLKKTIAGIMSVLCMSIPMAVCANAVNAENDENLFVSAFSYSDNELMYTLKVEGTVDIGGFEAVLTYDTTKYEIINKKNNNGDVLINVLPNKGKVYVSLASTSRNLTESAEILSVEFKCNNVPSAEDFGFEITNAYSINEKLDFETVPYHITSKWETATVTTTSSTQTTQLTTNAAAVSSTTTSITETARNAFIISAKESADKTAVDVILRVDEPVRFWTAEGMIKIKASGVGEPKLSGCSSDTTASFSKASNSILFSIVSSSGQDITESVTLLHYSFPIIDSNYTLQCETTIKDICNSDYITEEYLIVYDNDEADKEEYICGDLNNDGTVNLKDVVLLRRFIAGGWNVELDSTNT